MLKKLSLVVVENCVGGKLLCEETVYFRFSAPISSIRVICNMKRPCAMSLEMESQLAKVILKREIWNLF